MNDFLEERDDYLEDADKEGEESKEWMVTFTDMTLLVLVFFIFLFSLSTINKKKFILSISSVKQALKKERLGHGISPGALETEGLLIGEEEQVIKKILKDQEKVYADFNFFFAQHGLEGKLGAKLESGKVIIRVPSKVLFPPGKVELTSEGKELLKTLKDFFIRHPDEKINICGYTDDTPVKPNSRFKDNWELSALRAVNVLRYLIRLGIDPRRMTATGYGEMNPLYPNTSEENRSKNRRVEFVLEKIIQ